MPEVGGRRYSYTAKGKAAAAKARKRLKKHVVKKKVRKTKRKGY